MSEAGTIRNGARLPVAFSGYAGEAGVRTLPDGSMEVAFHGRARGLPGIEPGGSGTVGTQSVRVLSIAKSEHVKGMVVVKVAAVTRAP